MYRIARRPRILAERCEARSMLADVFGTAGADLIRLTREDDIAVVWVNESRVILPDATSVAIDAGDGDDTIRVDDAGGLPITIDGGAGADRVELANVDQSNLGNISVAGGLGVDTLVLDQTAGLPHQVAFDNPIDTYVTIAIDGALIASGASNDADTVEAISFRSSGVGDEIEVRRTSARVDLSILGGAGNDHLRFADDLDTNLFGPITFDGGDGDNRLTLDDSADQFADTYRFTGSGDTGVLDKDSGGSTLTYRRVNELNLYAGVGGTVPINQQFRATYAPAGTSITIWAGSGDDTLWLGNGLTPLDTFDATLVFAGGEDRDRILYNDTLGAGSTYTLNDYSLVHPGTGSLLFFDAESLNVLAGSGDDELTLSASSGVINVTLNGGGGNDRFSVGGGDIDDRVANSVSVVGGPGIDTLTIDDRTDDVGNDLYTIQSGLLLKTLKAVLWSTDASTLTETVSLLGSANDDTVHIVSASAGTRLSIDAGDGSDLIQVDRTSDFTGEGDVRIASGAGSDSLDVNGDFAGADASVTMSDSAESLASLVVRAGGRVKMVSGANLDVTIALQVAGTVDLGISTLTTPMSFLSELNRLAALGYANGTWTGTGIVSGVAGASLLADAVGVGAIGDRAVARYTIAGDASLDRLVGFGDLLALAQTYGGAGPWSSGDFNYDGLVGFDDLLILAQRYGSSI